MVEKGIQGSQRKFELSLAKKSELSKLHKFCTYELKSGFAPLEKWKERYNKNPNIFYIIKEVRQGDFSRSEKIIGSFSITPVTEETRVLIEAEKITGLDFTSSHITAPDEKPAALYITGIVAKGFYGRGQTLSFLIQVLNNQIEKGNRLFYTKPITRVGLSRIKDHGFSPVNPNVIDELNRTYKLEVPDSFVS